MKRIIPVRAAANALLFCVGCSAVLLSGCRSAISTHVEPDPIEGGFKTTRMRGIPVTVKVPTHLEVRVIERRYYASNTLFHTVRIVEHEIREKDQVFTVDSVRPAAGNLTYASILENKENPQFFSKFDTKIEDNTIKSIADLVPKLPDVLANLKKASAVSKTVAVSGVADVPTADVTVIDSLVAVKVFDVHAPDLSSCVQGFLDQYVNACAPLCPVSAVCPAK